MGKDIYIIGAGTYGAAISDLAETCGYNVIGFYDDDISKTGNIILGKPVLGKFDIENEIIENTNYVIAIGNNDVRVSKSRDIIGKGGIIPSLLHPGAEISRYATIGTACIVHAMVYIWTEAEIGDFSIISPNTVIAHHTRIGEGGFISTGCSIGAGINFGKKVFTGIGATVMTGVKIVGNNVTIGAGSVVIKDVEDGSVVAGVPAKLIRNILR